MSLKGQFFSNRTALQMVLRTCSSLFGLDGRCVLVSCELAMSRLPARDPLPWPELRQAGESRQARSRDDQSPDSRISYQWPGGTAHEVFAVRPQIRLCVP